MGLLPGAEDGRRAGAEEAVVRVWSDRRPDGGEGGVTSDGRDTECPETWSERDGESGIVTGKRLEGLLTRFEAPAAIRLERRFTGAEETDLGVFEVGGAVLRPLVLAMVEDAWVRER